MWEKEKTFIFVTGLSAENIIIDYEANKINNSEHNPFTFFNSSATSFQNKYLYLLSLQTPKREGNQIFFGTQFCYYLYVFSIYMGDCNHLFSLFVIWAGSTVLERVQRKWTQ